MMMDSENRVASENENGVPEKATLVDASSLNIGKGNENVDNGIDSIQVNGVPEDSSNVDVVDSISAGAEDVASFVTVSDSKSSNVLKKPVAKRVDHSKNDKKMPKSEAVRKGPTMIPRNQRPSLSQSLSFPSRGILTSSLKKSIDEKQMKSDTKRAHVNVTDAASVVSNGSLTSTSRSNISNRRVSAGLSSMDAKMGGLSARRTTLASMPGTLRSLSVKSGSLNATVNGSSSEASQLCDPNPKPSRQGLQIEDDEDAHSTTSSTTRRSSGSGFAFRLDERAEKKERGLLKARREDSCKGSGEIKQLRNHGCFIGEPGSRNQAAEKELDL
ncbi:protein WVD2-like 4 [Magnolia sinica]|uniref:protein WVD2-like 4 n=1 Tax=Magnolia sinica TaxID=86752 RepID=UPI002659DF30|nr:protein WVD2-like 4 [Magnolia sinica]